MNHVKQGPTEFCIDTYEYTACSRQDDFPKGGLSYYDCLAICEKSGKRLPTHNEWKLACAGTPKEKCNIKRAHPIVRMASKEKWQSRGINCKKGQNRWSKKCMLDYRINMLTESLARNTEFPECVSFSGARHMIGNLGEWVAEVRQRNKREMGTFNGGLYPQSRSSCGYSTRAHDTDYKDYSTGCRCAKSLNQKSTQHY